MEFQVVVETNRDLQDPRRGSAAWRPTAGQPRCEPRRMAHLVVPGAAETLCAEPVSRFVPRDGQPESDDLEWCWLCKATAGQ